MDYTQLSNLLKAMADPQRLKILEVISCGGKRACDILEFFDFTQPTLSHHMKTLTEAGLVNKSRDGRWIFYAINQDVCGTLLEQMKRLISEEDADCLCHLMETRTEIEQRKAPSQGSG